ncbi:hypothetical protein J41TS12_43110 [Paenibacillus antibioticophila]|uniref:Uncharacterized protein n=1 Tax=Paenibacillus antibioticophila TaxID=1274374 RepID=A0A919XYZ0_9BACL|nr:hypothetical protein [Paenibacillus antibioticophila]GIO39450.1 hypothetical protein J41TS12_43110 [Paenibacillus antibioticophila]
MMNRLPRIRRPLSGTMKLMLCLCLVSPGFLAIPSFAVHNLGGAMNLVSHAAAAAPANESIAPESLRHFAADTISKLSEQTPFQSWAGASTLIEPLGPGTRSWLVTIYRPSFASSATSSPVQIGYLIISAAPQGLYKLIEYGTGPDSLYSTNLASEPLVFAGSSLTIMPVYGGPLLAAWRVTDEGSGGATGLSAEYLDAQSGEALPETDTTWNLQSGKYNPPSGAYGSDNAEALFPGNTTAAGEYFNPYDNILWMAADAKQLTPEDVLTALDQKHSLVFAASGNDRTYRFPLPIYGYQTWDAASAITRAATEPTTAPAVYVLTGNGEGSSSRWISLDAIADGGSFHPLP